MCQLHLEGALISFVPKRNRICRVQFEVVICLHLLALEPSASLRAFVHHKEVTVLPADDLCMLW